MNIYSDIFDTYDIIATEADICVAEYAMESAFLSTLPVRGATANVLKNKRLPSAAFV